MRSRIVPLRPLPFSSAFAVVLTVLGLVAACSDDPAGAPGGGKTSGGPACTPPCAAGGGCTKAEDCTSRVCSAAGVCAEATTSDQIKNGNETDVDCGGGAPASACAAGKSCKADTDCFWGHCTNGVCEGDRPGEKDGDQTDIDCGGTASPPCDWEKACLEDRDCTSKACGADKKCLVGPSCRIVHGGTTCGTGEFDEPGKEHESCCKSLPVAGFADPQAPGKAVYVDKYEITAGRMRAFIESLGAAANVKEFMATHRPPRWNVGWENTLPTAMMGSSATFTVVNPTVDLLYPGQDQYAANRPTVPSTGPQTFSVGTGNFTIDIGFVRAVSGPHFFPEYITAGDWPAPDYAASHNLNCSNVSGAFGYSTYWVDKETLSATNGEASAGKAYTKDQMDEKALNCTTFGLFAAFCAWDGGQLMTAEVFDHIAGGPFPADPVNSPTPPRLSGGKSQCNNGTLNTFPDGGSDCAGVYFHPQSTIDDTVTNDFDGSARIAAPGRIPADTVRLQDGDEPWMDLIGNLHEAVTRPDNTRFDYRGYGVAWSSITAHRNQITTPRMKGGAFGARCMRFK